MKTSKITLGTLAIFGSVFFSSVYFSDSAYGQRISRGETFLTTQKATEQNIIVHLNHGTDDLHAAFMALKIAAGLQSQGARVTLVLTMEGVRIADTRQPQDLRWGNGPMTLAEIYDQFVKAGGRVMVCPACAKAVGLEQNDLRPGAKFAEGNEDIPSLVLKADKILDF